MIKISELSNHFAKKLLFISLPIIIYFLTGQSVCFASRITKGYISAEKNIAGNVTVNIKPVKKGDRLLVYRNGDLIAEVSIDLVFGNLVVAKVIKEEDQISKGDVCFLKDDAFSNYLDTTKKLKEKINFFIDNKSYAKAISHYNQLIKSDIDILPIERVTQERDLLRMLELLNNIQLEYSQKCYKKAISLFNEFPEEYLAPLVKNNIVVGNIKASEIAKRFYSTGKAIEDVNKRIKTGELVFFNDAYISREEKEKLEEEKKEKIKIALENKKIAQELELLEKTSSEIDKNKFIANLQKYIKSTVIIEAHDKQGSGFFVGDRGEIITCYHVIKNYVVSPYGKTIFIKQKENTYTASMIYGNPDHDFAIIKLDKKCKIIPGNERYYSPVDISNYELNKLHPLAIGDSDSLSIGDKVSAIGTPGGYQNPDGSEGYFEGSVVEGIVSQIRQNKSKKWIQISNPIEHGYSGGPLMNEEGEVIGINSIKYSENDKQENINRAVPINYIKKYLDRENINYKTKAFFGGYKDSLKIGINYLSKGQNQKAIYVFNQFIFQNPSISATYYFLGKAYESVDKSKAVENYKKYLQRAKYSDETSKYINYAKVYIKNNESQQIVKSNVATKNKKTMATIEDNILDEKTKQISDRNKAVFYSEIAIIFLIIIGLIFQPWNKRKNICFFRGFFDNNRVKILCNQCFSELAVPINKGKLRVSCPNCSALFRFIPSKNFPYSSITRRILAGVIDLILGYLGFMGYCLLLEMQNMKYDYMDFYIYIIILFLLQAFLIKKYGGSIGKLVCQIYIVDHNFEYLSWGKIVVRELIGKLILNPLTLFLGLLSVFFTPNRQTLHDKLAKTYVINKSIYSLKE